MMVITAVGNLTRDVEVKQRSDGSSYMQGSIAVNSGKDIVTYITFFSSNTKLAQYLKKGKPLGISGNATIQTYKNKDGNTLVSVTVSEAGISFINAGNGRTSNNNSNKDNSAVSPSNRITDMGDIPF